MFLNKYIFLLFFIFFNSGSFAESSLDNQQLSKTKELVKNVCMACHGMDGNSLNGKIAPKIAAQNAQYLTIQLNKFKDGIRKNALMQGIAASLSAEDMDNLGIYFSEQKLQLSAATSNGVGSKAVYSSKNFLVNGIIQTCFFIGISSILLRVGIGSLEKQIALLC